MNERICFFLPWRVKKQKKTTNLFVCFWENLRRANQFYWFYLTFSYWKKLISLFLIQKLKLHKWNYLNVFYFAGDLERLRRFWLTGTCNPKKEEKKASEPLAPEQFLSLFFILMFGVFLAICLMGAEHAYIKWIRGRVAKTDKAGCCALISKVSYCG